MCKPQADRRRTSISAAQGDTANESSTARAAPKGAASAAGIVADCSERLEARACKSGRGMAIPGFCNSIQLNAAATSNPQISGEAISIFRFALSIRLPSMAFTHAIKVLAFRTRDTKDYGTSHHFLPEIKLPASFALWYKCLMGGNREFQKTYRSIFVILSSNTQLRL